MTAPAPGPACFLETAEVNQRYDRTYTLVERLTDGLVRIERTGPDGAEPQVRLWTRQRVRKAHQCAATLVEIPVGADAYAPALGTEQYRAEWISAIVIDGERQQA